MNRNKAKGTQFETDCEDFLMEQGFRMVYRPSLAGADDIGDIDGVSALDRSDPLRTLYVIFQCKNQKSFDLSGWLNDTQSQALVKSQDMVDRLGDDADTLGILLVKRPKVGVKNFEKTYAVMELGTLTKLLHQGGFK